MKYVFFIALFTIFSTHLFASEGTTIKHAAPQQEKMGQRGLLDAVNAAVSSVSPAAGAALRVGEVALQQANQSAGGNQDLQGLIAKVAAQEVIIGQHTKSLAKLQRRPWFALNCCPFRLWCGTEM